MDEHLKNESCFDGEYISVWFRDTSDHLSVVFNFV